MRSSLRSRILKDIRAGGFSCPEYCKEYVYEISFITLCNGLEYLSLGVDTDFPYSDRTVDFKYYTYDCNHLSEFL
jgi:hypothetical protein